MPRRNLNKDESTGLIRTKINQNFTELYNLSGYYEHTQISESSVWTVNHSLNKPVDAITINNLGERIYGLLDLDLTDPLNTVIIRFSRAISGKAFIK